jgi:hypothetical protein
MSVLVDLSEVVAYIADQNARGRGLIAMGPLPTNPIDYEPLDAPLQYDGDTQPRPRVSPKVRLFFVEPDPHPEPVDPATITFTPDDAIAVVKRHQSYGMRVHAVGPVTDIRAALMTLPEVDALLEHGTTPGRSGTVPGGLAILVVIRGSFVVSGPHGSTTPYSIAYEVFGTRTGNVFRSGATSKDIVLP